MILWFALIVHSVFLYSVVDIYFRGMYDSVMEPHPCSYNVSSLSKRVVLIFANHIGADTFYKELTNINDSFVQWFIKYEGVSHISHPNNSKAKFQSIVTGTDYDGADFWTQVKLPPRFKESVMDHANNVVYIGNREKDFKRPSGKNWTTASLGNKCLELLKEKSYNLSEDKVLFLVDARNEKYGEGKDAVIYFDWLVGYVYWSIMKAYKDSSTTFIITSLGVDNTSMTETPFLTFGAGIQRLPSLARFVNSSQKWKTNANRRMDVNQTDIAVLIATLLGLPVPSRSNGILHHELLETTEENILNAVMCNQEQLEALLESESRAIKRGLITLLPLHPERSNMSNLLEEQSKSIANGNITHAVKIAKTIITVYLNQLSFYRNYFRWTLKMVLVSSYVAWALLLLCNILSGVNPLRTKKAEQESTALGKNLSISTVWSKMTLNRKFCNRNYTMLGIFWDISAIFKACLITLFVYFQNWPLHFLVYFLMLDAIWWKVCKSLYFVIVLFRERANYVEVGKWMGISVVGASLIILNANYLWSFGFMIATITLMPYKNSNNCRRPNYIQVPWFISAFSMILIFALKDFFLWNVPKLSAISWIMFVAMYLYFNQPKLKDSLWTFAMLFALALVFVSPVMEYKSNNYTNQIISWILIVVVPFFPIIASQEGIYRLFHICFAFACPSLIMTYYQESMGLLGVSIHLLCWYAIELLDAGVLPTVTPEMEGTSSYVTSRDIRMGLMLVIYAWIGFFLSGTSQMNNIFSSNFLKCFGEDLSILETIGLHIYKLSIPCIILLSVFRTIYNALGGRIITQIEFYLFLNTLLGLFFFLQVRAQQEVEQNLLRHLAPQIISILMVAVYPIASLLTTLTCSSKKIKSYVRTVATKVGLEWGE